MYYYTFNIGDYASHTKGLSLLEDLAYRRLLDEYYLAEHPLNGCSTEIARAIGMKGYEAEVDYVLTRFFKKEDDCWSNPRADKEISNFLAKSEKASAAGKASAERRINGRSTDVQRTFNGRSTDVQPTNNQEPITNNQIKDSSEKPEKLDKPDGGKPPNPLFAEPKTDLSERPGLSTPEEIPKKRRKSSAPELTLTQFIAQCKANGERVVAGVKALQTWQEASGVSDEMVGLAWHRFKDRYCRDENHKSKRYIDWRQVFVRACKENWMKCWNPGFGDKPPMLSDIGLATQREIEKESEEGNEHQTEPLESTPG